MNSKLWACNQCNGVLLTILLREKVEKYFSKLLELNSLPFDQNLWFFFFKYLPFKKKIIYLFIYFLLCWVFVSVRGLSLVVASGGHSSSWCAGLSLSRPLLLRSTSSRRAGSVVVAHGLSCSTACGILPDQGLNPCPLHWQADSQPLRHQGSPFLMKNPEACFKEFEDGYLL